MFAVCGRGNGNELPLPLGLHTGNGQRRNQDFLPWDRPQTKLKHIGCRQEWVKTLRNSDTMAPVHVDTEKNDAGLFTKILARGPFEMVRNRIMVEHNFHHD